MSRVRLPGGWQPYKGSAEWSLSREASVYLYDFVQPNRDYMRQMRQTFASAEIFFQTTIMNSSMAAGIIDDDLHYADWSRGGFHPEVLEPSHLPQLAASEALFARQFDAERSPVTLDLVDRELLAVPAGRQSSRSGGGPATRPA